MGILKHKTAAFWTAPTIQLVQLVPKPIPIYLLQEHCWRNYHLSVIRQTWDYIKPEHQSMLCDTRWLKAMFQPSLYLLEALLLPQCQNTDQRRVTLCWCLLQLSPEENCSQTFVRATLSAGSLASRSVKGSKQAQNPLLWLSWKLWSLSLMSPSRQT